MAQVTNYIKDLGAGQRSLRFKVRVVRMCKQPSFIKDPSVGD